MIVKNRYIKAYFKAFMLSALLMVILLSISLALKDRNSHIESIVIIFCPFVSFLLTDFRRLNILPNILFIMSVAGLFYYRGALMVAILNGYSL